MLILFSGQPLRFVLLGKTGVGKSHVGNVIVGREVFESKCSARSVTQRCRKEAVNEGRQIEVTDTPGVMDTDREPEVVAEEIMHCIRLSSPGPHAFLLVLQVGRFTQEEQNAVRALQEIFGKKVADYMIVVFSRADELGDQTIEDYVQAGNEKLRDVIRDCGGRYVPFYRDLHNRRQVDDLVRKVDELIVVNGGSHFSNEVYERSIRESNSQYFIARWLNNMTAQVINLIRALFGFW
ncbi:hypothetical protein ACEWY4_027458 [Coilia grayii]|uniref:AIG1-type G domain-containing protein n=1 Tax=Coilia grayii TaxID=363190 RepID=A0ABD1IRU7_9TELE